MKTNITMESKDRVLFGVTVRQETKNEFLNVTDLQRAYNRAAALNGWSEKKVDRILGYDENVERIYYLLKKQVFSVSCLSETENTDQNMEVLKRTSMNSETKLQIPMFKELKDYSFPDTYEEYKELVKNYSSVKVLKHFGVYKTTGSRETTTVWCNPYIWVLLALEMSPILYAEVVGWLTDGLIFNRIEAGDMYRPLTDHVKRMTGDSTEAYCKTAIALNNKVFGEHYKGIRQVGTKDQLHELAELEKKLSWAIDMGFIKTMQELWGLIKE